MTALDVQIIDLPAFRVASAMGFGPSPEMEALDKLQKFIQDVGLWDRVETLQLYGFNNPEPEPDNPDYGYEQWVVVPENIGGTEEVAIKTFPGGWYAVTRCQGVPNIYRVWHELESWQAVSSYAPGAHQWLEKWVNPTQRWLAADEMVLDLYLPIQKKVPIKS